MARPPTTPGEPLGRSGRGGAGFTLIELVTVIALVAILAAIALPSYRVAIVQSREAVLKENLYRMRDLIDQYYVDKGQYPPSLETLVEEGYLRKLPEDPMTQSADWTPVYSEPDPDQPGETPGVYDVKSASESPSLAGTPYSEW
jgi:general secretion pathway protein G